LWEILSGGAVNGYGFRYSFRITFEYPRSEITRHACIPV
jgi:hypothetical protein